MDDDGGGGVGIRDDDAPAGIDPEKVTRVLEMCALASVAAATLMLLLVALPANAKLRAFPARLTVWLAVADVVWFASELVNLSLTGNLTTSEGDYLCRSLGALHQFCGMAIVAWTCAIAWHVAGLARVTSAYVASTAREGDANQGSLSFESPGSDGPGTLLLQGEGRRRRAVGRCCGRPCDPCGPLSEQRYHLIVWPVCVALTVAQALRNDSYHLTQHRVCRLKHGQDVLVERVFTTTIPVIVGFLFIFGSYLFTWRQLRTAGSSESSANLALQQRHLAIRRKVVVSASRYCLAYLLAWAPTEVYELMVVADHNRGENEVLSLVATALLFSQGVLHLCVFVANKWMVVRRSCACSRSRESRSEMTGTRSNSGPGTIDVTWSPGDAAPSVGGGGVRSSLLVRDVSTASWQSDVEHLVSDSYDGRSAYFDDSADGVDGFSATDYHSGPAAWSQKTRSMPPRAKSGIVRSSAARAVVAENESVRSTLPDSDMDAGHGAVYPSGLPAYTGDFEAGARSASARPASVGREQSLPAMAHSRRNKG